jgi:anti-sigma regulatory factor (Ser/Thr protein kinase)
MYTATYEACKNAFEHGNNGDKRKYVTLADRIEQSTAEVVVIDEGGVIDPEFAAFVQAHRQMKNIDKPLVFYDFSRRRARNQDNLGLGTSFMHMYADEVHYFKAENGGLAVQLIKRLK